MMMAAKISRGKMNLAFIYGILNLPAVFSFLGISNTPPQTSTKANSVAILVKSSTNTLSVNRMGMPTIKPVTTVLKEGVLYLGCIFWNTGGSRPSRLMLCIIVLVIAVGAYYVNPDNWMPLNSEGVKSFMPNGFSGVMSAVSGVFFAYIGLFVCFGFCRGCGVVFFE